MRTIIEVEALEEECYMLPTAFDNVQFIDMSLCAAGSQLVTVLIAEDLCSNAFIGNESLRRSTM